MKQIVKTALFFMGLAPCLGQAQELDVDWELYPDYSPKMFPDYSLLKPAGVMDGDAVQPLPDHVHNGLSKFFPTVFNQAGGSCSMASRIGYMFAHELNVYRDLNGKSMENRYPSHFVWLMGNGNTGKYAMIQHVGVPSAATYGGATYSHLFGNQKPTDFNFGWMQGYDRWYSAMFNRMLCPAHFPQSLKTEEGRTALKRWLFNHNGDNDYYGGGVAGVGVGINGVRERIASSPANDEIGVTGMQYMAKWGAKFNHALTIVGYDDRVEFDLNGNGILGEISADERGAWILVNSWGSRWANDGFIYCPYANAVKTAAATSWWFPEIFKVRKNYRPLRTMKIKMDYSRRSEIAISAGIATDLNATEPEMTIPFHHFQYAGDGKNGRTNPAPQVPMLGKWRDGIHAEPMEFGYDLTDISANFNKNLPLKYFLIIETRPWAVGTGRLYNASVIDYEFDHEGVEVPFELSDGGTAIKNMGGRTLLSTVVCGGNYHEPQNVTLDGNLLRWDVPHPSQQHVAAYKVYCNGSFLDSISMNRHFVSLPDNKKAVTYSVSAVYDDGVESSRVHVNVPPVFAEHNDCINLHHSGFSIPNIYNSKYEASTIEFWIRPNSLVDYNQSGGPGWNQSFKFHSNTFGSFVVGWDNANRVATSGNTLRLGVWTHLAVVFNKNVVTLYVNGKQSQSFTSSEYSGLGGFEELDFGSSEDGDNMDASIDELRIWNYARSASEIAAACQVQYFGSVMPRGLLGYFKGDTTMVENRACLRDYAGRNHAKIFTRNFEKMEVSDLALTAPLGGVDVKINPPSAAVYCGLPVNLTATYTECVDKLSWDAEGAHVMNLSSTSPSFTFTQPGRHLVTVRATDMRGGSASDQCEIEVAPAPAPEADFSVSQNRVSSGEHITFLAANARFGYRYEWSFPGAVREKAFTPNAATTYLKNGTYSVRLKVTSPDGQTASAEKQISIVEVAPIAEFEVAPSVVVKGETAFLKDLSKYKPNHWTWQLHNEKRDIFINGQHTSFTPDFSGIYDVSLTSANASGSSTVTHKKALVVCNADSKNGLMFNSDNSYVRLMKPLFTAPQSELTFDCWMNPFSLKPTCMGFGETGKFMLTANEDGILTVAVGTSKVNSVKKFVIPNEWHHYAVTFNRGQVTFYRDGIQTGGASSLVTAVIPSVSVFAIGGAKAPVDGQIDEFRIWGRALDLSTLRSYANAPVANVEEAVSLDQLLVYYDFNQSDGDVEDRTGHQINGQRVAFGPDGDAWGLSQGVFSLDLTDSDITADYLKNYGQPFAVVADNIVNPAQPRRFREIADWTLENSIVHGDTVTCAHVDTAKYNCFTVTTGWDGFSVMKNHKAYQTITLPAGDYSFSVKYSSKKSKVNSGTLHIVAAEGAGLPDLGQLGSALASIQMRPRAEKMVNTLEFSLPEETEISLGLLINMSDNSCAALSDFTLERRSETHLEADNANGYDLQMGESGYGSLYLPYPTVMPDNIQAYTAKEIAGNRIIMEPVADGIIPARTGVVVVAKAGDYHFSPSTTSSARKSLLTGVLTDKDIVNTKRYYKLDVAESAGFRLYQGSILEANRAFLMLDADDSNDFYEMSFVPTGIRSADADSAREQWYDLSGRRVSCPAPGIYIAKGRKKLIR